MTESALNALQEALGDAVSTRADDLDRMRGDKSGHIAASRPLALVTARSVEDVQATLRIATRFGVPVVPSGAGTGLAGGAIAGAGRDRALHPGDEPHPRDLGRRPTRGRRTRNHQRRPQRGARRAGPVVRARIRRAKPSPASAATSPPTPAGCSAPSTASPGKRCSASRSCSPTATCSPSATARVKGVTGLDLTALMIGSEGTLGVIVEATLRLRPAVTGAVADHRRLLPRRAHRRRGVRRRSPPPHLQPAAMELMDAAVPRRHRRLPEPGSGAGAARRTCSCSSTAAAATATRMPPSASSARLGGDAELTDDPVEGERLLAIRRAYHPALTAMGTTLIEDVAVPRSAPARDVRRDRAASNNDAASASPPSRTPATATCTPTSSSTATACRRRSGTPPTRCSPPRWPSAAP